MKNKGASFLIGIPTLFLVLSLFSGGVNNAFSLLLLSVVCTLGLGLLLWVPLAMALGYVVLLVAHAIARQLQPSSASEPKISISKNQLALQTYIKQARAEGLGAEIINSRLHAMGWPDADIQSANASVI